MAHTHRRRPHLWIWWPLAGSEWEKFAGLSTVFTLVYPIGIPVFFFLLIWRNRNQLRSLTVLADLGFLYEGGSPLHNPLRLSLT
jgi:hypothetical protein